MKLVFRFVTALLGCLFLGLFPVFAAQSPSTFPAFSSSAQTPIDIEAEELEVRDQENKALFKGNVRVTQAESQLRTHVLTVYYRSPDQEKASSSSEGSPLGHLTGSTSRQQKLVRLEASGGVIIENKDQRATARRAVYDLEKDLLEMTGDPVILSQGETIIVGTHLVAFLKTGRVILTPSPASGKETGGRVRMRLVPHS